MQLSNEFQPIREWAAAKGILANGDIRTQTLKLVEEIGELAKALIEKKPDEVKDAIGDMVVVLTSVAYFNGVTIEECINSAFNEIAGRTGKMVDGTFIRDKNA